MRCKKIGMKIIISILPVILLAMVILTVLSAISSEKIIKEQINNVMDSELSAQLQNIQNYLNSVSSMANTLSKSVGSTYESSDISDYEKLLGSMAMDNDLVMGCGIWFEPYVFDKSQKYVGPYVYKEGSNYIATYDYSNADYDYFSQEYYKNSKSATKAVFTNPYYDETLDTIMSTCSIPIFNHNNTYIGCITVDMELTSIQTLVGDIKVGEGGSGLLLTADGTYIYGDDLEKATNSEKIMEDDNSSLAEAAVEIMGNQKGTSSYVKDKNEYNLYYTTLPDLNWKLIIQMPEKELIRPIVELVQKLIIVCIIAVLGVMATVLIQVKSISNGLKKVKTFASSLADRDFTIKQLEVKTIDELGQMGDSLNTMYNSNKTVIQNIANRADEINDSSTKLNDSAVNLQKQFLKIENYMSEVNEAMMSTSASTEEVNASTEEVNASVSVLTAQIQKSKTMSDEIKDRAVNIGKSSKKSFGIASDLAVKYEAELKRSLENTKVVESIGTMAGVISDIANQINLLSLNASIEAARAGEAGKGFAVVASEIGRLANDTAITVTEIQDTVQEIEEAFKALTQDSSALLTFVKETVTPDYQSFVNVAEQYEADANHIEDISERISEMGSGIERIMREVSLAIQSIAESAQSTAENSNLIMNSVTEVSVTVEDVNSMSKQQEGIAYNLSQVVGEFKLQ